MCAAPCREAVLQIAGDLYFTPAAAAVRTELFNQLAQGSLTGLLPSERGASQQQAATDAATLTSALSALCAGPTAPKLMALLLTPLGLREAQPIRKPVAAKAPASVDGCADICCHSCGKSHPEKNMLLCDGCDCAYHTNCLRPALGVVPDGDWFCHTCEGQIQGCQLTREAAAACLSAMLTFPEGRELIFEHAPHAPLLQVLQQLASQQVEELSSTETASTSAASALPSGSAVMRSAAGLYSRAALHLALMSLLQPGPGEGRRGGSGGGSDSDDDDSGSGGGRKKQPLDEAALKARREEAAASAITATLDCLGLTMHLAQGTQVRGCGGRPGHGLGRCICMPFAHGNNAHEAL